MDPGKERKIFGAFMAGIGDHHHQSTQIPNLQHHQIQHMNNQMLPFGMTMMQSASSSSTSLPPPNINKDGGAYELSELDRALFRYLDVQDHPPQQQQQQNPPHTLNIFPSEPMHVDPSQGNGGLAAAASGSSEPTNDGGSAHEPTKVVKRSRKGKQPTSSSEQEPKSSDAKTLRRLAQNREAARKSRLRKKCHIQQLESSKMKLIQLEQEMLRVRSQGPLISGDPSLSAAMMGNINHASSVAAWFDTEYNRWLEEHNRQTIELRRPDLSEDEVRIVVDNHVAHYDRLVELKTIMAKSDVFHILSGIWKSPAERCLLWMGGFRPSHVIEMISSQIEALTNHQIMEIYRLEQSSKDAEKAMSEGIESLNQSIRETITSLTIPPNMTTYTTQMAVAVDNLSSLEGFIHQADMLRQQILGQLQQILSTRQSAQCLLVIDEYFYRLRMLSSLWLARSKQD